MSLLATAFALLLTASTAAAELARHELRVHGSVQRVFVVDVDGNGRPELLAFSVSGDLTPQRWVSIFALGDGVVATEPRNRWELDPEGGMFDIGDDPQDGPSLWYCTPNAVRRYRLRNALEQRPAAETWLAAPSLLGGRSDEWVLFHDFVGDWHGDGRQTPAIIQPGRLLLPAVDPSAPPQVLALRTEIDTTNVPASYEMLERLPLLLTQRIPALSRLDADGDGHADLVASLGDRLAVYSGRADGTYAAAPQRDIRFPSGADPRDETRRQVVQLADVTGDGRVDATLSTLTGGFGNLTHTLAVFPGIESGFATRSQDVLTKNGAASLTTLADLDGKGRHEIVTVTVEIGVRALLSYLLTARVPIEYDIYRVGTDGRIGEQPMLAWTRRVDLQSTGPTDPGVVTLAGDFDGDAVSDVVSASDDDEIEIRRLVRAGDGLVLGEVLALVAAPGRGQALASDLNADGRSDLVVYAPRQGTGVVRVFLSTPSALAPEIKVPRDDRR